MRSPLAAIRIPFLRSSGKPAAPAIPEPPYAWTEWYRFARDEFGYGHDERVEYANLRFVEEQNRVVLRRTAAAGPP